MATKQLDKIKDKTPNIPKMLMLLIMSEARFHSSLASCGILYKDFLKDRELLIHIVKECDKLHVQSTS